MKRRSRVFGAGLVSIVAFSALLISQTSGKTAAATKSLIEVGWDAPNPKLVRARIKQMEKSPFAGTMINLSAGKTFLNKSPYPESAFTQDRADLAAVSSKMFNQNFITMWSARQDGWDWFNDSDWTAAQTNAANFASVVAASSAVQGLMFDPEPYGTNPWSYSTVLYPTHSFAEAQAKVRQRGASFMKAVQAQKSDIKILMLFGTMIVAAQAEERGSLEKAEWALYGSFIDGMLDVIGPRVQLIDGNEGSYYYTDSGGFDRQSNELQAARSVISESNRAKYDKQVSLGDAVFVEGTLNTYNSPRFFGFYLADTQQRQQMLEHNVFHALRTTSRYTWVYNEQMDWWGSFGKGVHIPDGLDALIRRAARANRSGAPLGFDGTPFAKIAIDKYTHRVELDGRVSIKGVGVNAVFLASGFDFDGKDMACETTREDGYYQCFVPPNWTGRITPKLAGYTFNPPFFQATNIVEKNTNVNFEATKK
jgi:hypothetical protein